MQVLGYLPQAEVVFVALNEASFLIAAKGVGTADTLFVIVKAARRVTRIDDFQHRAHIAEHKPRLTIALDDAGRVSTLLSC